MKRSRKLSIPKFNDYRASRDGVMVADVGFKKQLWALDPELDVVWDWGAGKWEIWKFPGQVKSKVKDINDPRATHVMTVQTQQRDFRELGADILLSLQKGDTRKYSLKQLVDYFDKMDDNIERSKRKDFANLMESINIETEWFTRGLRLTVPRRFMGGLVLDGPKKSVKMGRAING